MSASSYIPTEASAVTRAADNVSRVLGDEFNVNEFTLFVDFIMRAETSDSAYFFDIGRLTSTLNNLLLWKPTGGTLRLNYFASTSQGVSNSNIDTPQRVRAAVVFNKTNKTARLFTNGVAHSTINITTLGLDPTSARFAYLGSNFNNDVITYRIFPKELSHVECIELTKV